MYKSAILGCGGRARRHAQAYEFVRKAKLTAVCDMDGSRLRPFVHDLEIERGYADAAEMLDKEKPDLLHIVTKPNLRVPLLTLAHEHGVPAVIVEKPLALDADDFNAIQQLSRETSTKICVNHQLRYHPKLLELLADVLEGRIGEVRCIDASARLNLAGQGTHVLNMVFAFNGGVRPELVFGSVSGAGQLDGHHPAPDMAVAQLNFPNGVRALFACGKNAMSVSAEGGQSQHKRIAVYGTRGFIRWQMNAWERATTSMPYESGAKVYREEDDLGQAAMTDAMCEWLDDDDKVHANCLETSLAETNAVLGLYASALERRPVELPCHPQSSLLAGLRAALR